MANYEYIESYVHASRIGVLVHFSCNDAFALKTAEFRKLAKDLAMHIAASRPAAVDVSDLDPAIRNEELSRCQDALENLGEAERLEKIAELNKSINERFCLTEQAFIKEPDKTVGELLEEVSSQLRSDLRLLRFIRWEIDETP